jgi:hypothetical protein
MITSPGVLILPRDLRAAGTSFCLPSLGGTRECFCPPPSGSMIPRGLRFSTRTPGASVPSNSAPCCPHAAATVGAAFRQSRLTSRARLRGGAHPHRQERTAPYASVQRLLARAVVVGSSCARRVLATASGAKPQGHAVAQCAEDAHGHPPAASRQQMASASQADSIQLAANGNGFSHPLLNAFEIPPGKEVLGHQPSASNGSDCRAPEVAGKVGRINLTGGDEGDTSMTVWGV